jgi:hypothetical protein
LGGGDAIDIEGYYTIGKADFGENTETTSTNGFSLLLMLSALASIQLLRKRR